MAKWIERMWSGWPGWVLVIALGAGYLWMRFVDQEDERNERNGARIQQEVRAKVSDDLAADSAARMAKMQEALRPENLMKAPEPALARAARGALPYPS